MYVAADSRYPAGFPYIRGEGERGVGGGPNITGGRGNRPGLPGRLRGAGGGTVTGERERALSPPAVPNGDVPGLDRERGDQYKSGRGLHGNSVIPGGGGGGGKYKPDDRKIPRLKNTRHGRGEVGGDKASERGGSAVSL